jgi:hypothetical protein
MNKSSLLTFAMLAAACWSQSPQSDSRSNWLRNCTSQSSCGSALSCVCGVCTEPCASESACGTEREAVCMDPAQDGIGAECARAETAGALGICLLSCDEDDDCGEDQRCVLGACLAASLIDGDAGSSPPGRLDAGVAGSGGAGTGSGGAVSAGAGGGGTIMPVAGAGGRGPVVAGKPDAGPVIDEVDAAVPPACDSTLRECCTPGGNCEDGLVCHIDRTCIAAASTDENGVATIVATFPLNDELVAIDEQYAYALRHDGDWSTAPSRLVRWPLAGGSGEVLADDAPFFRGTFPVRVDAQRLYFVATRSETNISSSLYSMPKNDSAAPTAHGTAGSSLVDDADHLYFSNDGDSRVFRLAKATLGTSVAREQVFRSATDSPGTIMALAINSTHVLVLEQRLELDLVTFTVSRIDKASLMVETLGDDTKFTVGPVSASLGMPIFANDTHMVLVDSAGGYANLLDLLTLEVKPLPTDRQMMPGAITATEFYYGWFGTGPGGLDRGVDRLLFSTGERTELLAPLGVTFRSRVFSGYGSMVASPNGLFIVTGIDSDPSRLLRIAPNP